MPYNKYEVSSLAELFYGYIQDVDSKPSNDQASKFSIDGQ